MSAQQEDWHPLLASFLEEVGYISRDFVLDIQSSMEERESLWLIAGKQRECWVHSSLAALFRGAQRASAPVSREDALYTPFIAMIEPLLLEYDATVRPPCDDDLRPCFMQLRKEPDGESLGVLHDILWQGCCLALAKYPYSQEQFEAVMMYFIRKTSATKQDEPDYIDILRT